jgi:LmbE family N-acetylglucosaminyl deacetylase
MHAMIVAHPDDECLWCIEPLLAKPKEWEVIVCSTPTFDEGRIWNFATAMKLLGVTHSVLDGKDAGVHSPLNFTMPNLRGYESVLTHNRLGEYGHPHHKLVYARVMEQRPDAVLFGWGTSPKLTRRLTDVQFAAKQVAMKCYGPKFYEMAVREWFKGDEQNLRIESYTGETTPC